ncbi:MAG: phosphatase PAP2 family protein [Bacteroidales bacterium]|jgi:membrane-associated phospholipid phosphatase|nr:phosphatase PAP2 family protein [Bacteroidales bacterium]
MRSFVKIPALPFFALLIFALHPVLVFSQEQTDEETMGELYHPVPLSTIFHDIGGNALHSLVFNYGANFAAAGLGTWLFVESGLDWQWNRLAYDNEWIANIGLPTLYIGYVVPAAGPIALYVTGRFIKDEKLQIAGLALTQTAMLSGATFSLLKMLTGRALPGIVTELDHTRSYRTDDFSREFDGPNWNFHGGWPGGHIMTALSAATAIAEIYSDKLWLKIGVYSYAVLIGLGTSVNVHWASDVVAGALIGYAIGKTTGKSFNQLLKPSTQDNRASFFITAQPLGILVRF